MVLAPRGVLSRAVVCVAVPRPVAAGLVVSDTAGCLPLRCAARRLAGKAQALNRERQGFAPPAARLSQGSRLLLLQPFCLKE